MPQREIIARITERAFQQVMSNLVRPIYAEAMVLTLLGENWQACGEWDGWDLERMSDRRRLEVKQSAARQTWTERLRTPRPARISFDIRARKGFYDRETQVFVARPGRHAHVYVFAHHWKFQLEKCDQRLPEQWRFYVVGTHRLPALKSIGLWRLGRLGVEAVKAEKLRDTVEVELTRCPLDS